jgi:aspartyl-tRNA(Asn)/glutamyl-tRNA(Gln) amidotransferase subunit A
MSEHWSPPLWSMTATALVAGFAAGRFTPVDALRSVLRRLDAVGPGLNAVIAVDAQGAMAAAQASAARWRAGAALSALDGVPVSIKDNLFLAGLPATWGSRLYADFVPDHDEPASGLSQSEPTAVALCGARPPIAGSLR